MASYRVRLRDSAGREVEVEAAELLDDLLAKAMDTYEKLNEKEAQKNTERMNS